MQGGLLPGRREAKHTRVASETRRTRPICPITHPGVQCCEQACTEGCRDWPPPPQPPPPAPNSGALQSSDRSSLHWLPSHARRRCFEATRDLKRPGRGAQCAGLFSVCVGLGSTRPLVISVASFAIHPPQPQEAKQNAECALE